MAGNQRKNLEVGFDGIHNVSGTPLWRTWTVTSFISIANETEPSAASLLNDG